MSGTVFDVDCSNGDCYCGEVHVAAPQAQKRRAPQVHRMRRAKDLHMMWEEDFLLADSQAVCEGDIIGVNSSGLAVVVSGTGASEVPVGVAACAAVSGVSNATAYVTVQRGHTEWFAGNSNVNAADIGKQCVIQGDATVYGVVTETSCIQFGRIVAIETICGVQGCWVEVGARARDCYGSEASSDIKAQATPYTYGNPTLPSATPSVADEDPTLPSETPSVADEHLLEAAREYVYDNPQVALPATRAFYGVLVEISRDQWTGRLQVRRS